MFAAFNSSFIIHRFFFGLLVQRDDTCLASRKSGFNSPAVHFTQGSGIGIQESEKIKQLAFIP